jgi:oxalate---CoA ligase
MIGSDVERAVHRKPDGRAGLLTISAHIQAQAEVQADRPAMVGTLFVPLSYGELAQQIVDVRRILRQAGLGQDARIAIGIPDSAAAAWSIATTACSAAAIPLDPKLTIVEIERCFRSLRPNAVLLPRGVPSSARIVAERWSVPIIEAAPSAPGRLDLALSAPRIAPPSADEDPDPNKPAFILHTSGTTADPNLVPFSHGNVLASAERIQNWFGLTSEDRCLNVSPVYYSHALTTTVLPPLLTGGSVAFPVDAMNVDLAEWLGALRPTWYSAGPTMHRAILDKARDRPGLRAMHSLRLTSTAGAAIAQSVLEEVEAILGIPVLQHYGSSETAQIASNRPEPGLSKPGTCGLPWPGIIRIVGEDGREVGCGERGEIFVRGPSITSGYLNAPELNALVFQDGWYRTGDIGSLDQDGFLSLHTRRREIINRGAEKISPQEIDQVLMQHPDVVEAAAFGIPHPSLGEDVAAAVVLRPGATLTADALRAFAGERLAAFKTPRRISTVAALPKGLTGKIQRTRLGELAHEKPIPGTMEPVRQSWRDRLTRLVHTHIFPRGRDPAPPQRRPEKPWSEEALQAEVLKIWKRLLKVDALTIDDDFFEKGGDSLLAMDVHIEVQKLIGKELPSSYLSEASTVRRLVKALPS